MIIYRYNITYVNQGYKPNRARDSTSTGQQL